MMQRSPNPTNDSEQLPTVSIVTVCFNSAATIRDTIESVLSQDYPNIQYVIIDGGSTDGTLSVIREYLPRIAFFTSQPDRGIYDAMNKGILAATGDIIGMLNSDDFYVDSRAVSDLVAAMHSAQTDAVFADVIFVDRSDAQRICRYYSSRTWKPSRFRWGWMPAHPTFFIERHWYLRCGLFSLDYRIAADFEMLIRLLKHGGATYAYLNRAVVKMRTGGVSSRGLRERWRLNREIVRACRSNGIWTALPLVLLRIPAKLMETRRFLRFWPSRHGANEFYG